MPSPWARSLPVKPLCHGSLQTPAYPDLRAGVLKCRWCRSWVHPTGDGLVAMHTSPITDDDIARAASIIRWEYRQARINGTLHGDPDRWHVTALEMTRKESRA